MSTSHKWGAPASHGNTRLSPHPIPTEDHSYLLSQGLCFSFSVRHTNEVPEGQILHAVASRAHLLVHFIAAPNTGDKKEGASARQPFFCKGQRTGRQVGTTATGGTKDTLTETQDHGFCSVVLPMWRECPLHLTKWARPRKRNFWYKACQELSKHEKRWWGVLESKK